MAKKQIDLYGNKISPSRTREIEETLACKLERSETKVIAFKIIAYLKKYNTVLSLIKDKKYKMLLKYAKTQSSRDREIKRIVELLDKIYEEEYSKDYNFKYFKEMRYIGTKAIFSDILVGLRPLYSKIVMKSNELEHFRAYFEIIVFFIGAVLSYIEGWIEDIVDHAAGYMSPNFNQEIYLNTVGSLKGNSIDYHENPNVEVRMSFSEIRRVTLIFRIIKFYDLRVRTIT